MTTPHAFRVLMVLAIAAWHSQSVKAADQVGDTLAQATSVFGQRLYQQIIDLNPNLVFSPYSLHSALSFASDGANGQTKMEMRKVLNDTNISDFDLQSAYHNLNFQLNAAQQVSVDRSNAIYVNPFYHIIHNFHLEIAATYSGKVMNFDNSMIPEVQINDYVSKKTRGMVTEVLSPGSGFIDGKTLMLLVNAISFNGTWEHPFSKSETRKEDFSQTAKTVKQVEMMHKQSNEVMYKHDFIRKVDVIELPFQGDAFGLFVVLPHETEGLIDLEHTLMTNGEGDLFQNMKKTILAVTIPKFKVETTLSLVKALKVMGMERAFGRGWPDFTGISQSGTFYINDVIHKAVIEVTESGTTAAAAVVAALASPVQSTSGQFVADHPFMYFLRYKPTGHILLQGKYSA